jgi:hypothetical protein
MPSTSENEAVVPLEAERRRARSFGFGSLLVWACLGALLEAAHAFKIAAYLDVPLRRELLVWGHAHGIGLALVVLAYAANGVVDEAAARAGARLRTAAVLMPLGFLLGVFGHSEGDPGPAIWLVPLGALALLAGLAGLLKASLRQ